MKGSVSVIVRDSEASSICGTPYVTKLMFRSYLAQTDKGTAGVIFETGGLEPVAMSSQGWHL